MKYVTLLTLFFTSLSSYAFEIKTPYLHLTTEKVAHITGEVTNQLDFTFIREMDMTSNIVGDRIILINSPGGLSVAGDDMIRVMELERAKGIRQICVVTAQASSMAFNFLTHCDVRVATKDATFLVHKLEVHCMPPGDRGTARNLRELADEIDKEDEKYRQANSKALHITLQEYDKKADNETTWTAKELLEHKYLHGIIKIK